MSTLGLGVNRWRNPGESRHGLGAPPLLHEGLLILPYDGSLRVAQAGRYPNNTDEERTGWLYQERLGGKYRPQW